MPTHDEAENVRTQIQHLEQSRFIPNGESFMPVLQGEPPEHAVAWSGLEPDQKIRVMHEQVYWNGFTVDEYLTVRQNVADGKDQSHWMDGVEVAPMNFREYFRAMSDQGYGGFREKFIDDPELVAEHPDETLRESELRDIWDGLAEEQYWRLTAHPQMEGSPIDGKEVEQRAFNRPSYIPDSLSQEDAKALTGELDRLKSATYVDSEEQVAGWNYEQGEGGVRFDQLPVADREVMVEDFVDWGRYMERGLTVEDQGRIMFHGARDVAEPSYAQQLNELSQRHQPANDNREIER